MVGVQSTIFIEVFWGCKSMSSKKVHVVGSLITDLIVSVDKIPIAGRLYVEYRSPKSIY
jgi:hypothetical protein